jgi:hypothetical protein
MTPKRPTFEEREQAARYASQATTAELDAMRAVRSFDLAREFSPLLVDLLEEQLQPFAEECKMDAATTRELAKHLGNNVAQGVAMHLLKKGLAR